MPLDMEYVVDLVLAHAEAERQVNEWLEILNNPKISKRKRAQTLKLLRETSHEYSWLVEKREKLP